MWIGALVLVGLAIVWVSGGRRAWRDYRMGIHLSRMATVFEAVERTKFTHLPGAGGGLDSLPQQDRLKAIVVLEQGMANLREHPRHVVTRELLKNMRVADSFGRTVRVEGMGHMLDFLVANEIALGVDEFVASYG